MNKRSYQSLAPFYNLFFKTNESFLLWAEQNLPKQSLLFDAGCGTGARVDLLNQKGFQAFGGDLERAMLNKQSTALFQIQLPHIPFKQSSLGAITCLGNTLPHLNKTELHRFFQNASYTLKNTGSLWVQCMHWEFHQSHSFEFPVLHHDDLQLTRWYEKFHTASKDFFCNPLLFHTKVSQNEHVKHLASTPLYPQQKSTLIQMAEQHGLSFQKASVPFSQNELHEKSTSALYHFVKA